MRNFKIKSQTTVARLPNPEIQKVAKLKKNIKSYAKFNCTYILRNSANANSLENISLHHTTFQGI